MSKSGFFEGIFGTGWSQPGYATLLRIFIFKPCRYCEHVGAEPRGGKEREGELQAALQEQQGTK